MAKSTNKAYQQGGVALLGCMFLGVGIAMAIDSKYAGVGWLIGVGTGFLIIAVLRSRR